MTENKEEQLAEEIKTSKAGKIRRNDYKGERERWRERERGRGRERERER